MPGFPVVLVLAVTALTACSGEVDDEDDASFDESALASPASRTAPPDAMPPKPKDVSFARDKTERVYGVRIQDKPHKSPKVVYSVRLPDLKSTEELRVRGEVVLSRCNRKDIAGLSGDSKTTPCDSRAMRKDPYGYTPRFSAAFVLASSPTDATGQRIGPWSDASCSENRHHCTIALPEAADRNPPDAKVKFVNLVVTADADGKNARPWDVMEVEQDHGALAVTRLAAGAENHAKRARSTKVVEKHDLGIDQTKDEGDETRVKHVIYQVKLDKLAPGDVIDADVKMRARLRGGFDCDPLITGELIVTADKDAKEARARSDASFGPKNGHNCNQHDGDACVYEKSGAARLGREARSTMFVSYVATALRSCAAPNGKDKWYADGNGGFLAVNVRR